MEIRGLASDRIWDYENAYYWFSEPSRLNKVLGHYELYKTIVHIPGHVFELGVYKGNSLTRFATFRAALENDSARKIVGFDAFGKFPVEKLDSSHDFEFVDRFEQGGGDGLRKDEILQLLERKNFTNIELVEGDIFDTLRRYLEQNPETRLAMLHLDMDVKPPTEYALNELYDRVVSGGIIVIDDYNVVSGATEAVDEFIAQKDLKLEKLPFYYIPAFIRKP